MPNDVFQRLYAHLPELLQLSAASASSALVAAWCCCCCCSHPPLRMRVEQRKLKKKPNIMNGAHAEARGGTPLS